MPASPTAKTPPPPPPPFWFLSSSITQLHFMFYESYLNIPPLPNGTLSPPDRLVYVTNPTSTSRLYQTLHCHRQTDWFMLQILPQHPAFTKQYSVTARPTGLCYKSYLNIPPLPDATLSPSDRLVYVTNPTSTSRLYQTVHCHRDRLVYVTNPTSTSRLYQTVLCHRQTDLCYKTHLNISPSPNATLSSSDRLVYVTNPASRSRLYLNPASTSRLNQTVHCHRQTDLGRRPSCQCPFELCVTVVVPSSSASLLTTR